MEEEAGAAAVHPHACGEHIGLPYRKNLHVGSSPRMWGTRSATDSANVESSVHPHACGEHSARRARTWFATGSSPRMWGTQRKTGPDLVRYWFIPTHVGNTHPTAYRSETGAVHPHACGEHPSEPIFELRECGSSPRMWGTPVWDWGIKQEERFIPTHVGNTIVVYCRPRGQAVHPHACGEHRYCFSRRKKITGSSPRMWGTQILFQ